MNAFMTKQFLLTITLATIIASGAAYAQNKEKYSGSMSSIPHTTISFNENSSYLTDVDKSNLREIIHEAFTKGDIDQVTIAAWSDKELPKVGITLADSDRALAKSRFERISNFMKGEIESVDIATYNMAENTNWLAKAFKTSDSELKSIFSKKGATSPVTNAEYQLIKNEGGPSEAVVTIQRK